MQLHIQNYRLHCLGHNQHIPTVYAMLTFCTPRLISMQCGYTISVLHGRYILIDPVCNLLEVHYF